jgi:hypothetical protein
MANVVSKLVDEIKWGAMLGATPSEHRKSSYYKFTKLIFYIL